MIRCRHLQRLLGRPGLRECGGHTAFTAENAENAENDFTAENAENAEENLLWVNGITGLYAVA